MVHACCYWPWRGHPPSWLGFVPIVEESPREASTWSPVMMIVIMIDKDCDADHGRGDDQHSSNWPLCGWHRGASLTWRLCRKWRCNGNISSTPVPRWTHWRGRTIGWRRRLWLVLVQEKSAKSAKVEFLPPKFVSEVGADVVLKKEGRSAETLVTQLTVELACNIVRPLKSIASFRSIANRFYHFSQSEYVSDHMTYHHSTRSHCLFGIPWG